MIWWTSATLKQLGTVLLAEMDGQSLIYLGLGEDNPRSLVRHLKRYYATHEVANGQTDLLTAAISQIEEYLSANRRVFDLPTALAGTPFQLRVWNALALIPFGQTVTYGEIAARINIPGSARAVGQACGANPLPLIIPCHRILAQGGLGGFSGGLWYKRMLLAHEGISR